MGLFGSKKKAEEAPKEDALAGISRQFEEFRSQTSKQLGDLQERVSKLHEEAQKLATKREVSKMGEGFARVEDVANARKGLATVDDVANSREGLASESYVDNSKKDLRREIGSLALRVETLENNYRKLPCQKTECDIGEDLKSAKKSLEELKKANEEAAGKLKVLDAEVLKKEVYAGAFKTLNEKLIAYLAEHKQKISDELADIFKGEGMKAKLAEYAKTVMAEHGEQLRAELQIIVDDAYAKCAGKVEKLEIERHKLYFASLSSHHQNLLVRLVSCYGDAHGAEDALSNPKNKNFDENGWDQLKRMIDSARRNGYSVEYFYPAAQDARAKSNLKPS